MELQVTTRLNADTEIKTTFDAEDLKKVVKKAGALLDFDRKCGMCEKDNFTLQTRSSKDGQYQFTEFVCRECGARRSVRFNKTGDGTYLGDWEEKWSGPAEGTGA
jgi:hypothetical protein